MRRDEHDGYVVSLEHGPVHLVDRVAPEWRELCAEGPCDEPFYDPAWTIAYVTEFEREAPVSLITVRRLGRLRAVLPLVERSVGVGPLRVRWLRSAANSHFPRFDVVHGAGDAEIVASLLWRFLVTDMAWDLLQFESAPAGGVAWRMLELAGAAGRATRIHRPDASPYIDTTAFPADVDGIFSNLSPNLRHKTRRSMKRLRSRGTAHFRIVDHAYPTAERDEAVQALYRLEASGWKGVANTAIASDPATRAFYGRVVANAVATRSLAICELRCDDDLVASSLDLIWNGRMYELKAGYDESYSDCSPGHLAKAFTLEAAPAIGITILDNCGRSDPHKLAWTSLSLPFATCFVGNKTLRGRLAWAVLFRAGPQVRQRMKRVPIPKYVRRMLG